MEKTDQKIIDATLDQLRAVHANMGKLWDADTMATFYYSVLSGTIARNGPEVANAIAHTLTQVFDSASKSHANLGSLTNGFPNSGAATSDEAPSMR